MNYSYLGGNTLHSHCYSVLWFKGNMVFFFYWWTSKHLFKIKLWKSPTVNIGLATAIGKSGRLYKSHLEHFHISALSLFDNSITEIDVKC